jgi:hypothetical protein
MRSVSVFSLTMVLGFASGAQAQQTGDAISDGLAALLGRAQQGTQTAPAPVPLGGNMIDATSPQALAELLQQQGYRAVVGQDTSGNPKIDSSAAGVDYSIYFYGCNNGSDCQSLNFSSGFDLDRGTSFQAMNDWNSSQFFAYAYLDDESDPFLNMDMNLAYGVSADNFVDSLAIWEQLLSDFQGHIDW